MTDPMKQNLKLFYDHPKPETPEEKSVRIEREVRTADWKLREYVEHHIWRLLPNIFHEYQEKPNGQVVHEEIDQDMPMTD